MPPTILDNNFTNRNNGETPPTRRLECGDGHFVRSTGQTHAVLAEPECELKITNLDRADPANYTPGDYQRGDFNSNVGDTFLINSAARMPEIQVVCDTKGFDPADVESPIHWRLSPRQCLGRHTNTGNYRYASAVEVLTDEWQGTSTKNRFTLFEREDSGTVKYTYNTNSAAGRVMGGHALLTVSVKPKGVEVPLKDYVHIRIGGTNPTEADVLAYLTTQLAGRNHNIFLMIQAAFAHESNYRQFYPNRQTRMRYSGVRFDHPDDPVNFPLVTFDFGIGISQYTRVANQAVSPWVVWDWRDNVAAGVNLFLRDKLRSQLRNRSWASAAWRAWKGYNGSGAAATAYANNLLATGIGQQISEEQIPANLDINAETARLPRREAATPPTWPPADMRRTTELIGPQ